MIAYYAHHKWKYNTPIEDYEVDLIRRGLPGGDKYFIINPSVDISQTGTEDEIMERCLAFVQHSDVLIFSDMDGCIGMGVAREIECAFDHDIPVYHITRNHLKRYPRGRYQMARLLDDGSNPRIYKAIYG